MNPPEREYTSNSAPANHGEVQVTAVQNRTLGREREPVQYVDLFCGRGRYEDGALSTPVKIVEQALTDPVLCERLVTIFNDKDQGNTDSLRECLQGLTGSGRLRTQPKIYTGEIDDDVARLFERTAQPPTFAFIDPFGYKGLTLRLVNSILRNWGCDCVFFFNYNRINTGIVNDAVDLHMDALFGTTRASAMRDYLNAGGLKPHERESFIVEEMCAALREMGGKFVLPFRFCNKKGTRTTHHLIFVTKNFRGYDIMKGIMAASSSVPGGGEAKFEYNPADARQPKLYGYAFSDEEFEESLLDSFAGRTVKFGELYESHSANTRYLAPSYRQALCRLEAEGTLAMDPPSPPRRRGTVAEHVKITFLKRGALS